MSTYLICVHPHYITHLGPIWTPSQPQNGQRQALKHHVFPCRPHKWVVWGQLTLKSRMQSLCPVNLSPHCPGTLYHPSGTHLDPIPAPKRPETSPKTPCFPNRVGEGVDNASSPPTTFNPANNLPILPNYSTCWPPGDSWASNRLHYFLSDLLHVS